MHRSEPFPPEWRQRLESVAQRFELQILADDVRLCLRNDNLELIVRAAGTHDLRWAVFALRLISGAEASDADQALHFSVLNHRLLHLQDWPVVIAFDPVDRAWEALFQIALDGLPDAELPALLALYLSAVNAVIHESLVVDTQL